MDALEPRVSLVTLAVEDLAVSTRFYKALGWSASFANDEVVFFQLGGLVLGLWHRPRMAAHHGVPEDTLGAGGIEVAHNVRRREEVDAVLALATRAGAQQVRDAADAAWGGRSGHFADPDGYRWEIAWNPAWNITDDGRTLVDS